MRGVPQPNPTQPRLLPVNWGHALKEWRHACSMGNRTIYICRFFSNFFSYRKPWRGPGSHKLTSSYFIEEARRTQDCEIQCPIQAYPQEKRYIRVYTSCWMLKSGWEQREGCISFVDIYIYIWEVDNLYIGNRRDLEGLNQQSNIEVNNLKKILRINYLLEI